MTDKSTRMVLAALSRAAASPDGAPLFAVRGGPGLFPAAPAGRQAAQRCKDEGWLRFPADESDGSLPTSSPTDAAVLVRKKPKATTEICYLTEKGLTWLLSQTSPREVLEDFIRALEGRQATTVELLAGLQQMQAGFDALKAGAETVLERMTRPENGAVPTEGLLERFQRFHQLQGSDAQTILLARLREWQASGASDDCPLPELFHRAQINTPDLSIGAFHDGLRRLHDAGLIYLHPWTGPLHALPEPSFALLVGHEIAYYASIKGK